MLTGIGGGLARDLLLSEIPVVLRREIYALASLVGAAAVAILVRLDVANIANLILAGVLIFAIRLVALQRRWSAPTPRDGGP